MKCFRSIKTFVWLLIPVGMYAQEDGGGEGLRWGPVYFRPEASILEAYDNRVLEVGDDADGDFYSEIAAGGVLENLPARYDLAAYANYGYRFYSEYTDLNDDFYSAGASIGSSRSPLVWGLTSDLTKSLGYNAAYDPSTGTGLDPLLTDEPNRQSLTEGHVSYDKQLTDKMSLLPGYRLSHYYQDSLQNTAEWQIHSVDLMLEHRYSEKTFFNTGASYSLQVNDDENGYVGRLVVGAEGRPTDKTLWKVELGYAVADYEISGTDQGPVSDVRVNWQATEKVSAYLFGGNDFQPGYDNSAALRVYRAGYGLGWQVLDRLNLSASGLHDYQEEIRGADSGNPEVGIVRHFFEAQAAYALTSRWSVDLKAQHNKDELETAQTIASVRLGYRY